MQSVVSRQFNFRTENRLDGPGVVSCKTPISSHDSGQKAEKPTISINHPSNGGQDTDDKKHDGRPAKVNCKTSGSALD